MPEDDQPRFSQPPRNAQAVFQELAEKVGVLKPGESLTEELRAFADGVAALCGKDPEALAGVVGEPRQDDDALDLGRS